MIRLVLRLLIFHRQEIITFKPANIIGENADIPDLQDPPLRLQPGNSPRDLQIFSDIRAGEAMEINDSKQIAFRNHVKLPIQRHSVKSCVSDIRQNQRMTLNWTHSVA